MDKIRINGKDYDLEKVTFLGQLKIRSQNKTLRITGGILFGVSAFLLSYSLITEYDPGKEPEMIAFYIIAAVVGAILFGVSFIFRHPVKVGKRAIEKGIEEKIKKKYPKL